jgi:hypothetical protein
MTTKTFVAYSTLFTFLVMLFSEIGVTPAAAKMCWPPTRTDCQYGGTGGPQRANKPTQPKKPTTGQTKSN